MDNIKICYIISNVDRAIAFEWVAGHLDKERFDLSFILLNPGSSTLENFLNENNIPVTRVAYSGKKHFVGTLRGIIKILRKLKPDVIHCHLFDAGMAGLLAGKIAGIKKRVYTRHHSTYNWQYNRKGVWLDKCINAMATDLVAISKNVQTVLVEKEKVNPSKVHLIHHGFDLEAFQNVHQKDVEQLKAKYKITENPVIGVISRWFELKGIQYIIPAFHRLLSKYPEAVLVLANARGPYTEPVKKLLEQLPTKNYRVLDFEPNLFVLYKCFDIYVHVPVDQEIEAFGQTYVEALAAGIPSVFTLSGVAREFVEHEKNALVVPFRHAGAIFDALLKLLTDGPLRSRLAKDGLRTLPGYFALSQMIHSLENLYER